MKFNDTKNNNIIELKNLFFAAGESDNGVGLCGWLLTMISWGLVLVTLPFSLCVCFKVSSILSQCVCFKVSSNMCQTEI